MTIPGYWSENCNFTCMTDLCWSLARIAHFLGDFTMTIPSHWFWNGNFTGLTGPCWYITRITNRGWESHNDYSPNSIPVLIYVLVALVHAGTIRDQ